MVDRVEGDKIRQEQQKEKFQGRSWLDIIKSPEGQLEQSFTNAVENFAQELKLKTLAKFQPEFDLNASLEQLSKITQEYLKGYFSELSLLEPNPQPLEKIEEETKESSQLHENEKPNVPESGNVSVDNQKIEEKNKEFHECEEAEEEISEDENLIETFSCLFRRILKIFCANNRSVQELFESIDVNKDGRATEMELRLELLKHDPTITEEECKSVFAILDGNNDGSISLDELQKRIKLLQEKAEAEAKDPLAHMVFSNPLNPALIHGNLSVILIKATGLRPGTHCVKLRMKNSLEYTTSDTIDTKPNWNFRCDFIFENKTKADLPGMVEFDLLNKNKIEGSGEFQWKKAMDKPNEFSLKVKTDAKTSTGQLRGTFYFSVKWTPIMPRILNEDEKKRLKKIRTYSEEYKRVSKKLDKVEGEKNQEFSIEDDEAMFEFEGLDEDSKGIVTKPGEFVYIIEKTVKVVERSFTNPGLGHTHNTSNN